MTDTNHIAVGTPIALSDAAMSVWRSHVLKEYPKEAVAFLVDGIIYPISNVAETPTTHFAVSARARLEVERLGTIRALLHSHPYKLEDSATMQWNPAWPSEPDMIGWIGDNIPWGISTCDGSDIDAPIWMNESYIAPLVGREFIHGVHDCYSLVRDWFRVNKSVTLPNFPRGMAWWYTDRDHYMENFRSAGFTEIAETEAVAGDCVLMKFHGDKVSHAAVITGPNQILHHAVKRLSGHDSLSKWRRQIVKYVRYNPQ